MISVKTPFLRDFLSFLRFIFLENMFPYQKEKYSLQKASLESDLATLLGEIIQEQKKAEEIEQELSRIEDEKDTNYTIIKGMLPVIDSLERLLGWGEKFKKNDKTLKNWLIAIEGIYKRIIINLKKIGLEEIDPIGKKVNLKYHEVIEYRPTYDHSEGHVIETKRKGYIYKGEIFREAQVVVAQNLIDKGV